ncbi:MAG: hypothetical protein ACI8Z9_000528 [Paraglaciecola sp.]|jgi:predicted metal-dependent TIM-barrel fold hydrolase
MIKTLNYYFEISKMNRLNLLFFVAMLSTTPQTQAQSWLDSLKSMMGIEQEKAEALNINDMVSTVTDSLGVTQQQASGGLGSLFTLAKNNISAEQYSQLASVLPGVDTLLKAAPDVSAMTSEGGLSGLMDKAADYNESLKAINKVKKQFESLGLDPKMITQFAAKAKEYLDTEEGQQAKELLSKGLGKLLG